MKKWVAMSLSLFATVFYLAACGQTAASTASTSTAPSTSQVSSTAAQEINAGVFYYNFADVYLTSVRSNMDKMLTEMGVKFQNYDGNNNQANQLDQINTAITNGVNLLIVNIFETSSPDAAQNAVDIAREAGIPIIFFNREVSNDVINSYDKAAFVGTDAAEAGHMQGQLIADVLLKDYDKYDLNKDGEISYVMFKGQEGNAEAEFRTKYAVEDADKKLTEEGKKPLKFYDSSNSSKYLVDQNGAWSSQAATDYMTTILSEYTEANKNMVELVIANNDGMAEGAISALQTAGYNKGDDKMIPVFGVDAVDSAKLLIKENKMTGTIMQDAEGMAKTITTLVKNVQDGKELMDNTSDFNIDSDTAKIRVPYGIYTGEK